MNNPQNEENLPEKAATSEEEQGETEGVLEFVTPLVPMEQQVGSHVIAALQHPETVAVVSTVAARQDGTQCIVSVGLDPEMLEQVQQLIIQARQKKQRTPCIGFHCFVDDPDDEKEEQEATDGEDKKGEPDDA